MGVSVSMRLEVQLSVGLWTDITVDTVASAGVHLRYGIDGNGPTDCLAGTGELSFTLRNDARNSGGVQGWYSPAHASRRPGWTFGIPVRVVLTYSGTDYTKFRGKIREIVPDAGQYGMQRVRVVAYDGMRDLVEADVRAVAIQVNKTEAQLLDAALDSLETESQPIARDLNAGVDSYPYAFDKVGEGVKAAALIKDVVQSAYGLAFVKGDGTFAYRNRHARAAGGSAASFSNTMHGVIVPSSLDRVFNHVRVTIHPKAISASATDELYTLPSGSSLEIPAGSTREVWTKYSDPADRQTNVGGVSVVTSLVAGTHYAANSAAGGGGTDLTASITASISPFASTALWTLTNTGATTAYIILLKVIGKAVRDPGPQTFEAFTAQPYGDRPVAIDMPYQDDGEIGRNAAYFVEAQYRSLSQQIERLDFIANDSAVFMMQALAREPGDLITITEPVTGLASVDAVIHSVELEIAAGPWVMCHWGLAPAAPFAVWLLGSAGASELGETTALGF
jgi:hypothetical protein